MIRKLLVGIFFFATASVYSDTLELVGNGIIGEKETAARVFFQEMGGGSKLKIVLTYEGTLDNYAMAQVLTDINFDMDGATITGGSVKVADGSNIFGPTNVSTKDISSEWVWATDTILTDNDENPFGNFDFSVSSTSFDVDLGQASSQNEFAPGDLGGAPDPNGIDGGDFGLMNEASILAGSDGLPNNHLVANQVEIVLQGSGFELDNIGDVYFSFGSAHTAMIAVPEPATVALFGMALAGLGVGAARRRRRLS